MFLEHMLCAILSDLHILFNTECSFERFNVLLFSFDESMR